MGYKGRKARLKNFERRADSFYVEAMNSPGKYDRKVSRDGKQVRIGMAKHKRLVLKRTALHAEAAKEFESQLFLHCKRNRITPKAYVLVPVAIGSGGRVQEYFNRPSHGALMEYFSGPERRAEMRERHPENYKICKRFINQPRNNGITRQALGRALEEISGHAGAINRPPIYPYNLLILGRLNDGRLRVAIIDV